MTLARATPKQRETLIAYVKTGSVKEAAALLRINERTAHNRLQALYRRIRVTNAVQAAYLLGLERRQN